MWSRKIPKIKGLMMKIIRSYEDRGTTVYEFRFVLFVDDNQYFEAFVDTSEREPSISFRTSSPYSIEEMRELTDIVECNEPEILKLIEEYNERMEKIRKKEEESQAQAEADAAQAAEDDYYQDDDYDNYEYRDDDY